MHHLRRFQLRIGDNNITHTALGRLGHNLARLPALEELDLGVDGMNIGERGLRSLCGGTLRNAQLRRFSLNISECAIGCGTAAHLGRLLRKNSTLRSLRIDVSGNMIFDGAGWRDMCRVLEAPGLEEVHLLCCENVADDPATVVAFVEGLRRSLQRRSPAHRLGAFTLSLVCTNADDALLHHLAVDWDRVSCVERLAFFLHGNNRFTPDGVTRLAELFRATTSQHIHFLELSMNHYARLETSVNLAGPLLRCLSVMATVPHQLIFH